MYYGARYYSPEYRVFVQPDTLLPDPYNPQALNRYSYALNNPVKYTDPSGHIPLETIIDASSLVSSVYAFYNDPNLVNGVFLTWDATVLFVPYAPGSWTIKAGKAVDKIPGGKSAKEVSKAIDELEGTEKIVWTAHEEINKELIVDSYGVSMNGYDDNSFSIPFTGVGIGREMMDNYLIHNFDTDAFNDINRDGWALTSDGILKNGKVLIEASSRSVHVLVWKDVQTGSITIEKVNSDENEDEI